MTMTLDQFTASFEQLRRTATRDEDVAQWFQENPAMLPGLPVVYQENVKVIAAFEQNLEHLGTRELGRRLNIRYCAKKELVGIDDFVLVTGMAPTLSHVGDWTENFRIDLPARDWTYVCTASVYTFFTRVDRPPAYIEMVQEAFSRCYPAVPWDTLLSLKAADLLPTKYLEFCAWLRTFGSNTSPDVTLPHMEPS